MVEADGIVRKWGNSFGIMVSKDTLEKGALKQNSKVHLIILPAASPLKRQFGIMKGKLKITGQQLKDMAREELYD